jgi:hypothetical protein
VLTSGGEMMCMDEDGKIVATSLPEKTDTPGNMSKNKLKTDTDLITFKHLGNFNDPLTF